MRMDLGLPWPPSTNSIRIARRGRLVASPKARLYRHEALQRLALINWPRGFAGPCRFTMTLHPGTRRRYDPDNRTKSVLDALVAAGVLLDDDAEVIPWQLVRAGRRATAEELAEYGRMGWVHVELEGQ